MSAELEVGTVDSFSSWALALADSPRVICTDNLASTASTTSTQSSPHQTCLQPGEDHVFDLEPLLPRDDGALEELVERPDSNFSMLDWSAEAIMQPGMTGNLRPEEDDLLSRALNITPLLAPLGERTASHIEEPELRACVRDLEKMLSQRGGELDSERSLHVQWVVRCLSFSRSDLEAMAESEREMVMAVRTGAKNKRQQAQAFAQHGGSVLDVALTAPATADAVAGVDSPVQPLGRKTRPSHSAHQKAILQKYYEHNRLPDTTERAAIAKAIGLSARAVKVWFQNRRQRQKPTTEGSSK